MAKLFSLPEYTMRMLTRNREESEWKREAKQIDFRKNGGQKPTTRTIIYYRGSRFNWIVLANINHAIVVLFSKQF